MLTFYTVPVSNFGAKVALALAIKDIPHSCLPPPGGYGSPTYKAIVPAGTVPAIVHDGLVLSESDAILEYLDEVFPLPRLMPDKPAARARVRQLMRFHDSRLEPPLRALFPQMSPATRDPGLVTAKVDEIERRLGELEDLIDAAPYAVGTALSLADCAFPATLLLARRMFAELARDWPVTPRIVRWEQVLLDEPRMAPVLRGYVDAVEAWLASKRSG